MHGLNVRAFLVSAAGLALAAGVAFASNNGAAPDPATAIQKALALSDADRAALRAAAAAPQRYIPTPGELEFTGQMIVRPRQEMTAERKAAARARLLPSQVQYIAPNDEVVIQLPAGVSENQMAAVLLATGDYQYAEPNWLCYPVATVPNDPNFGSQYHHTRLQSTLAWDIITGLSTMVVANCDTGVNLTHADLAASLLPGYNAASNLTQAAGGAVNDINGHGTITAGCMMAIGNNAVGVAGMGWNFKLRPVRVSNSTGGSSSLTVLNSGALWAAQNGCKVVNTSYSGVNSASVQTTGNTMRVTYGSISVWAAGNSNANLGNDNYPDVVIVGATDQSDLKASFSNWGAALDCVAPGVDIVSTSNSGGYTGSGTNGTSFAAPIAAGAIALVYSVNPTALTPLQVVNIVMANCDDLGAAGKDTTFGWGRVNMARAVADAWRTANPSDLPFFDTFDSGTALPPERWLLRTGAVSTLAVGELSPPNSLLLSTTQYAESNAIRLASAAGKPIRLEYVTQRSSVESGEQLVLEYLNASNAWVGLDSLTSNGVATNNWFVRRLSLPAAAFHNKFAFRFRAVGDDATDRWFIDNVRVGCPADLNGDGETDFSDIERFVSLYNASSVLVDFNSDGEIDFSDIENFLALYNLPC